jgi:hypothetical protein
MARVFAAVFLLSYLVAHATAQAQPAPGTAAPQITASPVKPATRKLAPKARIAGKPPGPAENGPCQIGVIPAIGNQFVVQKVGIMVFGNEHTEVPIDAWGLDELGVARVRAAAAPGTAVRRIAYSKGAFAAYDEPPAALFRNPRDDLTAVVRRIAANASCERYVVFTRFTGRLEGTNQTLDGVGVLHHGAGLLSRTSLFANIQVTVFDGQTFAIQKSPFANLGSILAGTFSRMTPDPVAELDNASFPEPATEAANSALLRDRTRALLTANLDKTLPAYLKGE